MRRSTMMVAILHGVVMMVIVGTVGVSCLYFGRKVACRLRPGCSESGNSEPAAGATTNTVNQAQDARPVEKSSE
jgi:hypothetical protein